MADRISFLKMIYGEPSIDFVDREQMNSDKDFEKVLNDSFLELGETHGFLYYDIAPFLLEKNSKEQIATYLKENADEVAGDLMAVALRFLRHPHSSKRYLPFFLKYSHKLEDEEWDALELDLLGHPAANDAEAQKFINGLRAGLDKMSSEKIDAILAVRFGKDIVDKNDPAVIDLYNDAMADLKAEINK